MNFFSLPRRTWKINLNKIVSQAERENKSGSKQRILDKINKSNALCPHRMRLSDFRSAIRQMEIAVIFLYTVMAWDKYVAEKCNSLARIEYGVKNYEI
jgi:hypothetical protein